MNIPFQKYHHGNLRDDILKAAYSFVKVNGYAAMSLRGIADQCNVSATAIYRHYETKEHLLADNLNQAIRIIEQSGIDLDEHSDWLELSLIHI